MAELCLNGMIKPYRRFPKEDRYLKGMPSGRVKKSADKIKVAIENNLDWM